MSGAQTRERYFKNFLIFSTFCLYIGILATLRVETTEWILMNLSPILYHTKSVPTEFYPEIQYGSLKSWKIIIGII